MKSSSPKLLICCITILFACLFALAFRPSVLFTLLNTIQYNKCNQTKGALPLKSDLKPQESEISWPVFLYPAGYGAEKYRLRTGLAMEKSSCNFFRHKSAKDVLRNIEDARNVKISLLYKRKSKGNNSFGGSLSPEERKSYFHYDSDGIREICCGFLSHPNNGFKVSSRDRQDMECCRGFVVVSAIFGAYDKLRQPRNVKRITALKICFFMFVDKETLDSLAEHGIKTDEFSKIGRWRIVLVTGLPYNKSVMNGLIPKYLLHRLFPNSVYSLWVDAKLQLVSDPLVILDALLVSQNATMAISKHPYNVQTLEEAIFTVRWHKWNKQDVLHQMESYCKEGLQPWSPLKLPFVSDVPDTGLIFRKHELATDLFSCLLFNEVEAFNPRDQLAFAYVRDMMTPKPTMNMFEVDVFNTITSEYRHNILLKKSMENKFVGSHLLEESVISFGHETACHSYLNRMWNMSVPY